MIQDHSDHGAHCQGADECMYRYVNRVDLYLLVALMYCTIIQVILEY